MSVNNTLPNKDVSSNCILNLSGFGNQTSATQQCDREKGEKKKSKEKTHLKTLRHYEFIEVTLPRKSDVRNTEQIKQKIKSHHEEGNSRPRRQIRSNYKNSSILVRENTLIAFKIS